MIRNYLLILSCNLLAEKPLSALFALERIILHKNVKTILHKNEFLVQKGK